MKAYPPELRERAVAMYERGVPGRGIKAISLMLDVPDTTVRRWVNPEYDYRMRVMARARKVRYRGTCAVCDASISHGGGDGRPEMCAHCVQVERSIPQWAVDHVTRLYERGESVYSMARRIMGSSGFAGDVNASTMQGWVRRGRGALRSRSEAQAVRVAHGRGVGPRHA